MERISILIALSFLIFTINLQAQTHFIPTSTQDKGVFRINSQIKGVWKSIGDGFILDATADKIKLYNLTNFCCYQETDDYQTNLLNTSALFTLTHDTLRTYLHDLGKKSDELQSGRKYVKLPALPKNCSSFTQRQQNNPEFIFDVFWHTLKENYAFEK